MDQLNKYIVYSKRHFWQDYITRGLCIYEKKNPTYIFRGGGHVFRILDRQVEVVVVLMAGGPHVSVIVHVQPQTH